MDNKISSKSRFSDVYEQIGKDLPIMSQLRQMDNKIADKCLISSSDKYLDLLSQAYVMFDINAKDLSPLEESVVVCDQVMSVSNKFELKRTNQLMDKSLNHLRDGVHSIEDKLNDSIREMKSQSSFESVMTDKIKFYSTKFKEYYNCVKTRENSLSKIGFTSDLKRETIEKLRVNNEDLSNRLNDINARLEEYKAFNPTESDLKNKINSVREELTQLDDIFNKL